MDPKLSSTHNLVEKVEQPVIVTSYDVQKRMYDPETQTEPQGKSYLGLILFLVGFFIPVSWIIGAVICFSKGHNHSKGWGIANLIAAILLVALLSAWGAYIIVSGDSK